MLRVDENLSNKIRNASLIAALLVVVIHIRVDATVGSALWWLSKCSISISTIAVPFFFVVSGFFLAGKMDETGWWYREVGKRIRTLMVPYCVWALLFLVFCKLISFSRLLFAGGEVKGVGFSIAEILGAVGLKIAYNPIAHPPLGQLWYLRTLMLFVLLSPIIKKFMSVRYLCFVFLAYVCLCPWGGSWAYSGWRYYLRFFFSLEGLFFFSLGVWLRQHGMSLPYNRKIGTAMFLLGVALNVGAIILKAFMFNAMVSGYCAFCGMFLVLYGSWGLVPSVRLPDWLVRCSFSIFILHVFFRYALEILLHHSKCLNGGNSIIGWCSYLLFGSVGSICVFHAIELLTQKKCGWLWGGR